MKIVNFFSKGWSYPLDYEMAIKLYRKASERNYRYAINNLGVLYKRGMGVQKSLFGGMFTPSPKASAWVTKQPSLKAEEFFCPNSVQL